MQPVRRALKILSALSGDGAGKTLGEISMELDLPPSTTHRFMAILEDTGFAVRTKSLRYILGPAASALVSKSSTDLVRAVATPVLRMLSRNQGETAFLAQMIGSDVVCIDYVEGTKPLRHHVQVGSILPANAASSARAILAQLSHQELDELLKDYEFIAFTENSILDAKTLKKHLTNTKKIGYDVCNNEMENHMWAVSAPLFGPEGAIPYALTIVAPLSNMDTAEREQSLINAVTEASQRISEELGGSISGRDLTV